MIKIQQVGYTYETSEYKSIAIEMIDLHVEKGDFVAVIGHNGSGKSTLAKLINGILLPTEGNVFVAGMNTKDDKLIWEIRKTAGMVFQNPDNQIVATVVEEDVAFGPENLGLPQFMIRERVDSALAQVGMSEHMKKPPYLLSGGQKQRVAIAGILAMKPDCIVLDEPTAMLDPVGRKEVMETIEKLNRDENITVIHITHFMEEAIKAKRVVVIEEGKVIIDGTPNEVFKEVAKLQDMGLDVPQVTLMAYHLRNSGINIKEDILTVEEMVEEICQLL
ncbi:MAG: energy-coupling factor transporter ATPase [Clostridiales bacterium]|nr:energy-coupling factor transporter ATPase [Clostridiales bacterium]